MSELLDGFGYSEPEQDGQACNAYHKKNNSSSILTEDEGLD